MVKDSVGTIGLKAPGPNFFPDFPTLSCSWHRPGSAGGQVRISPLSGFPSPLLQTRIKSSLKSTLWPPQWVRCGKLWTWPNKKMIRHQTRQLYVTTCWT